MKNKWITLLSTVIPGGILELVLPPQDEPGKPSRPLVSVTKHGKGKVFCQMTTETLAIWQTFLLEAADHVTEADAAHRRWSTPTPAQVNPPGLDVNGEFEKLAAAVGPDRAATLLGISVPSATSDKSPSNMNKAELAALISSDAAVQAGLVNGMTKAELYAAATS